MRKNRIREMQKKMNKEKANKQTNNAKRAKRPGPHPLPEQSSATVLYDSCSRSLARHDRNFETKLCDFDTKLAASFNLRRPDFLGVKVD